ncbi:MAG: type II secretion system F family protein [Planctomycetota bacterium]|nr:type II secretion system F family protein [Planctomycetota bacterium]
MAVDSDSVAAPSSSDNSQPVGGRDTPVPPPGTSVEQAGGRDTLVPPPSLGAGLAAAVGLTGPLSPADLALFAEMLAGLVRASLPLPDALRLIGKEAENRRLRQSLEAVEKEVAAGAPLPDALRRCQGRFPELFTRLLEQGCAASDLHAALVELVREYRSQARFREQLWSQLMGPIVTAVFFGIVLIGLIVANVPTVFGNLYNSLGATLPLPTRLVLEAGRILRDPYALAFGAVLCLCALVLGRALWKSRRVRYWVQRTALRMPVAGPYLRTVMVGRFCRLLSILLHRRVPMNAALVMVRDSVDFVPVQEAVGRVADEVGRGGSLPDALAQCRFFPPTLSRFVRGAEVHGDLPLSLSRLADLYDERANLQGTQVRFMLYLTAQLTIGALVLVIVLSGFLPIFKIQEMMRKK